MKEFFSNPFTKGQYEYLSARKRQQLRFTICCAFLVVAFFALGLLIYHKQRNILVVPAALMVLPMANFLVTYLALAKGRPMEEEKRRTLQPYEEAGLTLFHLMYVDEKGKRFYLDHVITYHNAVVAYGPSVPQDNKVPLESDCILRFKKKNINLRLKVFTDWQAYLDRLKEIDPQVPADQVKFVERTQQTLLDLCL